MEMQEFGEMRENMDEMNFALDGLRKRAAGEGEAGELAVVVVDLWDGESTEVDSSSRKLKRLKQELKLLHRAHFAGVVEGTTVKLTQAATSYACTNGDGVDNTAAAISGENGSNSSDGHGTVVEEFSDGVILSAKEGLWHCY
ncbi:hypothetical protein Droror1_Dr00002960 [Drosera rotundifolia]